MASFTSRFQASNVQTQAEAALAGLGICVMLPTLSKAGAAQPLADSTSLAASNVRVCCQGTRFLPWALPEAGPVARRVQAPLLGQVLRAALQTVERPVQPPTYPLR